CPGKQGGIRHRARKLTRDTRCNHRQRDFRRGGLRTALCSGATGQKPFGARVAAKFSETAADPDWLPQSQIASRKSQITSWLRSFPTAPLKRKQSRSDLRTILLPVPSWLSKANWAAARPCSRRLSSRVWKARPR